MVRTFALTSCLLVAATVALLEPSCQSDSDHGWPRFESVDQLSQSKWGIYIQEVYGALPTEYPVCIFDFSMLYPEALSKAGIDVNITTKTSGFVDGDLISDKAMHAGWSLGHYWLTLYHSKWQPLASNTWFEIQHIAVPWEADGFWAFRARGTGVWANSGNTIVLPDGDFLNHTLHVEASKFLARHQQCHGINITDRDAIFGRCAREIGYDSIQFSPDTTKPWGTFGNIAKTELVIPSLAGQFSCGTSQGRYSPLRSGWAASNKCACENAPISKRCDSDLAHCPLTACKLEEQRITIV